MLENYEINNSTLAIIPIAENMSKIFEEDQNFTVCKNPTEIIEDSCKFFWSSYLGRHEGTKSLIGINYKSPIIIEESREIIFFPTSSPRFNNCSWISLRHICDYQKNSSSAIVNFKSGQKLELDISYGSLENQIFRATRLESILRRRKLS